ncbi:MAG: ferritin family protein [Elusimicrobiales bacterium]|nr:ferritin family protein [Elusimicrobiales bacterium]
MREHLTLYLPAAIAVGLLAYLFLRRRWLGTSPAEGSRFKEFGENIHLRDLFRLAVLMEEDGRAFYLKMAEKAADKNTKTLCSKLAEEESAHRQLFLDMLGHWNPLNVNPLTWPAFLEKVRKEGFYGDYLDENASEEQMAVYAMRQEVIAANFYQLFEEAFPEAWKRARLHKLVTEERAHEAKLRAAYPHIK